MISKVLPWIMPGTGEFLRLKLKAWQASLAVSVFLILFANRSFWLEIGKVVPPTGGNVFFLTAILLFLIFLLYVVFFLLSVNYVFKPVVIMILLTASMAAYFMDTYGVMIEREMVRNTLQTNVAEARDLLSFRMLSYLILLGVFPSLLVWRFNIQYHSWRREIAGRVGLIVFSLASMAALLFAFYGDFILLGKNHKYVRHMINPVNVIYGVSSYTSRALNQGDKSIKPVGLDAKLMTVPGEARKRNLFIFVLGETARAKNFSLNGYEKETNPRLSQEAVFNFTDFYSCGTATAYSLPCVFSPLEKSSYSPAKAAYSEGLLDVLSHAGVNVLWRENQSGCKGTCDRVAVDEMAQLQVEGLCDGGECFDMVLLDGLQQHIDQSEDDLFIVLHQMGSHGPAYYRRVPPEFKTFTPVCEGTQLKECAQQEVVNGYDNTILYTDYFLSEVIGLLKQNSESFNTGMVYVSDHGESLGENDIYLHGMPYLIAPDEQKHVPFIVWLSDSFMDMAGLQPGSLAQLQDETFTHDIIFHTVLGAMGVETETYDARLDLFATSREQH